MSSDTIILLVNMILVAVVPVATLYINKRWSKETADDLKTATAIKADTLRDYANQQAIALKQHTDQQADAIKAQNIEQIAKIDATREEINGKLLAALAAELARGEAQGIIKGIEIERVRHDAHRAEMAVTELAKEIKKDKS
jgi:hypothetical protein